jgi:hypothetical protein
VKSPQLKERRFATAVWTGDPSVLDKAESGKLKAEIRPLAVSETAFSSFVVVLVFRSGEIEHEHEHEKSGFQQAA